MSGLIDPKDLDAVKDRKVGRPRKVRKTSNRKPLILKKNIDGQD